MPVAEPQRASAPIDSPNTEGAIWSSSATDGRIIYGIPGEPPLVALACVHGETPHTLRITRMADADKGAGALLALVGNGHIGRMEVDATDVDDRSLWQGDLPADNDEWEPLLGPRSLNLTVPGAGMVTLNPSDRPAQLIEQCRSNGSLAEPLAIETPEPEEIEPSEVDPESDQPPVEEPGETP